MVTSDSVRVREKPGIEGRSLLMLNKGHLVVKIQEQGDWTKIYFLGREEQTGHTEGWMFSRFLKKENDVTAHIDKPEYRLTDRGAKLSCEKNVESETIQGCDLHLRYTLFQQTSNSKLQVNCNAELVAKTHDGSVIPVPVKQILEHRVEGLKANLSMHILMKADTSYGLQEVDLRGHRCEVIDYDHL